MSVLSFLEAYVPLFFNIEIHIISNHVLIHNNIMYIPVDSIWIWKVSGIT